jgi:hypothetical protein
MALNQEFIFFKLREFKEPNLCQLFVVNEFQEITDDFWFR